MTLFWAWGGGVLRCTRRRLRSRQCCELGEDLAMVLSSRMRKEVLGVD